MNSPQCVRCETAMEFLGQERFRVGGQVGGWGMLLGELNQLGEDVLVLDAYRCAKCRRVEFFDPGR